MREFAMLSQEDRADALTVAARRKGMHPAIVEKDFWVCWTLDYLFNESAYKDSFAFKGGTSLSKGFDLIERFSEDIDLIFDWRLLGYELNEPWEKRSNTKQDEFVKRINEDAASFLRERLLPEMQTYLEEQNIANAMLQIDEKDPKRSDSSTLNPFPTTPSCRRSAWRQALLQLGRPQPSPVSARISPRSFPAPSRGQQHPCSPYLPRGRSGRRRPSCTRRHSARTADSHRGIHATTTISTSSLIPMSKKELSKMPLSSKAWSISR